MQFLQNHKDYYGGSCTSPGFPYWGVLLPVENLLILPQQEKIPPLNFYSAPPPTKQQFSSYNPTKTAFLAVGIAPAPLF